MSPDRTRPESDRLAPGDGLALVVLLAGAAAIRALAWSRTAVLFNDGPIFLAMADALREGRFAEVLAHPHHPLYPACVSAVEGLGVAPETAAVTVSILGGLLAVAAVHRLAFQRFGASVAVAAGAIVALHPWAVDFSADVMSDGLYCGLFLAGVAGLVDLLERPNGMRAAGFGLVVGLAYLTRPEGLVLALVGAGLLAVRIVTRPAERRASLRIAVAAVGVVILFVGGLRFGEGARGDGFSITQKKSVSVLLEGGPSDEAIEAERRERRAARRNPDALPLPEGSIRVDGTAELRPARSLAGAARAAVQVVATSLSAVRHEVVLFALIGIVARFRFRRRAWRAYDTVVASTLLVQGAVLCLLVWGAGYVSRRHALAAGLALCPVAAVGWQAFVTSLDARVGRRLVGAPLSGRLGARCASRGAVWILVGVLALSWGPRDLRVRRADRAAERRAAEWLAARDGAVAPVAAQKRRTAYYAGAVFVPIPDGRAGDLERQLRGRRAGHLIIDRAKLGDHLGLAEGIGRWLVPIHVERSGDQEVLVLALSPPAG